MIVAYDSSGDYQEYIKKLLEPTGIPFQFTQELSDQYLRKVKPSSILWAKGQEITKNEEEIFGSPNREYLLVVMSKEEDQLPDIIRYSSEYLITNSDSIDEVRRKLKISLTNHRARKLKELNDMSLFLAKNGFYPGNIYFTEPENSDAFLQILLSKHVDRKKALVVSRFNLAMELPEALDDSNFLWVTDSIMSSRNRPVNLTFIFENIIKRVIEGKVQFVMIDIFDFLLIYHSFQDVSRVFEQLKSAIIEKNSYLLIVLSKQTMESIQYGQVTRYGLNWVPNGDKALE
jgi:hypothetical protein